MSDPWTLMELRDARDAIARVTAERDALRAQVERVRPVVEGLAVACDKAATHEADAAPSSTRWEDCAAYVTEALPCEDDDRGAWDDCARSLRALLDPVKP